MVAQNFRRACDGDMSFHRGARENICSIGCSSSVFPREVLSGKILKFSLDYFPRMDNTEVVASPFPQTEEPHDRN